MVRSMTGFGTGRSSANGLSVVVELRSVNNRFLDFSLRTPHALYPQESGIRKLISARVHRGRMSVYICEEWSDDKGPNITIDNARANVYAQHLAELNRTLGLQGDVRLEHILSVDNIFTSGDDEEYRKKLWQLTQAALDEALDKYIQASTDEGRALYEDIKNRTRTLNSLLDRIKSLAQSQVENYSERLRTRLGELLSDERLDPNRLETELALAADKLDITEEMVRLESHLAMFDKTLKEKTSIGKTLGFIIQEILRETNTIASKSWSVDISQAAIQMKETIEQIREQSQNIE